jgi:hypothetical protein
VDSTKRGGPGRGQGRPPVKAGEETVTVSLRMTPAQREKLERLGGAKWVRERIERAKEPNDKAQGEAQGLSRLSPGATG